MPENERTISSSIAIMLLIASILIFADLTGYLTGYKNIRNFINSPFLAVKTYFTKTIGYSTTSFIHSKSLKSENLELRQKILELDDRITTYEENKTMANSVKVFLDETEDTDYKNIEAAEILSMNYNNLFGNILLSKGTEEGIEIGMPVVFGSKYVGFISEVYNHQSLCTSYLIPNQEFVGYIPNNKVIGILHTTVNYIEFQDLLATDKVELQDSVKMKQEKFPYYFEIGKVTSIPRKDGSAEKLAILESSLDIENYYFVTIIKK